MAQMAGSGEERQTLVGLRVIEVWCWIWVSVWIVSATDAMLMQFQPSFEMPVYITILRGAIGLLPVGLLREAPSEHSQLHRLIPLLLILYMLMPFIAPGGGPRH
jgi:hypothetical protein